MSGQKSRRTLQSLFSFADNSNERISSVTASPSNYVEKRKGSFFDSLFACFGYKIVELSNPPSPYPESYDGTINFNKRNKANKTLNKKPSFEIISSNIVFTLDEIYKATNNFSKKFLIGEGGSGLVYKGQLSDRTFVAIKRAKKNEDWHSTQEAFRNEIETLQRIQHLNLVAFYGYLEYETEQIIVVEYVPNGNLREHLDCLHGSFLDFGTRLDIAIDVAHGITYLHTYCDKPIIHRDIKSSNILLTKSLHAKVTDFGLSRYGPSENSETHIQTRVKGTPGYVDPEYFKTSFLTEKSDVFSFGVLLVELMTGRRPMEPRKGVERITTEWVMEEYEKGNAMKTLDPKLKSNTAVNLALEQIYHLASQCLKPKRQDRPGMKTCAEILWSVRKSYLDLSLERRNLESVMER